MESWLGCTFTISITSLVATALSLSATKHKETEPWFVGLCTPPAMLATPLMFFCAFPHQEGWFGNDFMIKVGTLFAAMSATCAATMTAATYLKVKNWARRKRILAYVLSVGLAPTWLTLLAIQAWSLIR